MFKILGRDNKWSLFSHILGVGVAEHGFIIFKILPKKKVEES